MMSHKMRLGYISLLAALLLEPVRAQQPTFITLSCSGTQKLMTDDAPTPVVNIGFVVDLNGRTVAFASHHVSSASLTNCFSNSSVTTGTSDAVMSRGDCSGQVYGALVTG
jgi:hypothetical protein